MLAGSKVDVEVRLKDNMSAGLGKLQKSSQDLSKTFKQMGTAITGLGVAGGLTMKGWVESAAKFEQTKIAFNTIMGSAEDAQIMLEKLMDFAKSTPFTLEGVEQNAKLLMAMGIQSEDIIPTLKSLGDVSAGLSVDLSRVALNYGQIATQGKLTGMELKDFLRMGVPLLTVLGDTLNKTEAEIKEMASAGEISFEQVKDAFTAMSSEGGQFADLMDAQSKSLNGVMSNIGDSFELLKRDFGAILLPTVKAFADRVAGLVEWFKNLDETTKLLIVKATAVSTAFALIAGPLLLLIGFFPQIVAGAIAVGTALGTMILPVSVAAGIIATLYVAWTENWWGIQEKTAVAVEYIKEYFEILKEKIATSIEYIKEKFEILKKDLIILKDKFVEFKNTLITVIEELKDKVPKDTKYTVDYVIKEFTRMKDWVINEWEEMSRAIKLAYDAMLANIHWWLENYYHEIVAGLNLVKQYFVTIFNGVVLLFKIWIAELKMIFTVGWELFSGAVKTALLIFSGDWKGAWEEVKQTFTDIWEAIKTFAKETLGSIGGFVDGVAGSIVSAIGSLKTLIGLGPELTPIQVGYGASAVSGAVGDFPHRAEGGPVASGTPYMVGEEGPELFIPTASGQIFANDQLEGLSVNPTAAIDSTVSNIKATLFVFRAEWQAVWEGIRGVYQGVWNDMRSLTSDVLKTIEGYVLGMTEATSKAVSAVQRLANSVGDTINAIQRLMGLIPDLLKSQGIVSDVENMGVMKGSNSKWNTWNTATPNLGSSKDWSSWNTANPSSGLQFGSDLLAKANELNFGSNNFGVSTIPVQIEPRGNDKGTVVMSNNVFLDDGVAEMIGDMILKKVGLNMLL